jgi:hypothetical protein
VEVDDFFKFDNIIEEQVYHNWTTCDNCQDYPLYGVKFSCKECDDFDLCEACFDIKILKEKSHNKNHSFESMEVPDLGNGFPVNLIINIDTSWSKMLFMSYFSNYR